MKTTRTSSAARRGIPSMPVKTSMIKFVLIIALIASGGAISLAAGSSRTNKSEVTPASENPEVVSLYTWIRESLHCPEFMDAVQNVEIWLRVGDDGHIRILRVVSEDARLEAYVMKMINGKTPGLPISEMSRDYHFSIRFQLV